MNSLRKHNVYNDIATYYYYMDANKDNMHTQKP